MKKVNIELNINIMFGYMVQFTYMERNTKYSFIIIPKQRKDILSLHILAHKVSNFV